MSDYQKIMAKKIQEEANALTALKLSSTELLNAAATAIAYLKLMDVEYNDLLARYLNLQKKHVDSASLPNRKKDEIDAFMIAQLRADHGKILADYFQNRARKGGNGKVLIDSNGKQKAKELVKECWKKWQLEPDNYKSKAAFARDMLSKNEDVLSSSKVIEDWCREWEREK
jgi:hypothetical protein